MGYIPGVVERQLKQLLTLLVCSTAVAVTVLLDVIPTLTVLGSLPNVPVCVSR
jgi:hypothetical protein